MTLTVACRILTLALLLLLGPANTVSARERSVFYPNPPTPTLRRLAEAIRDTKTPRVPYAELPAADQFFVRVTERKHILAGPDALKEGASLHVLPYVFLTTPEGLYNLPLLDIIMELGSEAERVIAGEMSEEMVAVVFRYPDRFAVSTVRDGALPEEWADRVFEPTWENVFGLFHRLAARDAAAVRAAACQPGPGAPAARALKLSDGELDFVINFPAEGKQRVRAVSYGGLKAAGGSDWVYRRMLEKQLSLSEHFRGNGRTQNELRDADGTQPERGLREYVGPNAKVADLREVAVVSLGRVDALIAPRP